LGGNIPHHNSAQFSSVLLQMPIKTGLYADRTKSQLCQLQSPGGADVLTVYSR